MTLHAAIAKLLEGAGQRGLAFAEITRRIRELRLYLQRNGEPPSEGQVRVRINSRPALFAVDKTRSPAVVRLVGSKGANAQKQNPESRSPDANGSGPVTEEWWWEGNVVKLLAKYLESNGWTVRGIADTITGAPGADLEATQGDRILIVEAKGYPSTRYRRGPQAGQPKRTHPSLQARHWYAEAMLSVLLRRHERPEAEIALGLPETRRYRELFSRTAASLDLLGIGLYLVRADGSVQRVLKHEPR